MNYLFSQFFSGAKNPEIGISEIEIAFITVQRNGENFAGEKIAGEKIAGENIAGEKIAARKFSREIFAAKK